MPAAGYISGAAAGATLYESGIFRHGKRNVAEILVIAPGASKPTGAITSGIEDPGMIAFDPQGNFYVANCCPGNVLYFSRGTTKPARTIDSGTSFAAFLALDSKSRLYVVNCPTCWGYGSGPSSVSIYDTGTSKPAYTITDGVENPSAIVLDAQDRLYVASCQHPCTRQAYPTALGGYVSEYLPGERHPAITISNGISGPFALALDAKENLYVANIGCCTTTVYALGHTTPARTLIAQYEPLDVTIAPTQDVVVSATQVFVFPPKSSAPIGLLQGGGIQGVFDKAGNLYEREPGEIEVYSPGSFAPSRIIPTGDNEQGGHGGIELAVSPN